MEISKFHIRPSMIQGGSFFNVIIIFHGTYEKGLTIIDITMAYINLVCFFEHVFGGESYI